MTPERHARIQQIFEAAVELPTAGRQEYLREVCAGDHDLRLRIDRLLGADSEAPSDQSVKVCPHCSRCYDGMLARCPTDSIALETALFGPLLIDGKYLIERRLGHGGMGAVYQVRHVALEKIFALKLIMADRAVIDWYRKSFENEAHALGKLKHPNIVDVTDYGIDPREGGVPYLVMEYLEGQTLRDMLKHRGLIPFSQAAPMLREIAAAIDFAHARNVIHADLKPGNLFLANGVIKVVDFGLARLPSIKAEAATACDGISTDAETITEAASVAGTPPYMAPELFRLSAPSKASDRFAFGVVAYEMLTNQLAYGVEGCRSARFLDPPAAPSSRCLPAELDAPLLALLDPVPERRPATASAAVEAMNLAWAAARQREWRAREVPRRIAIAAAVALAVVLLAALVALLPIAKSMEERTVDARFGIMPAHSPDPRLMVIAIDEAALAEDPRPLGQWDQPMSAMIERVLSDGARRVAIDILLPASWAASGAFTSAVLHHADRLTLALESSRGNVIGQECIAAPAYLRLGPERFANLFGFTNLEEDEDRVIRHARAAFPPHAAAFATRGLDSASASVEPFWIDYSAHPQEIPTVAWNDAQRAAAGRFRDRVVFIGTTYTSSGDEWPIPTSISRRKIAGVVLEAEIANTIAADFPVRGIPAWFCLLFAGIACFAIIFLRLRYPHRAWIALTLTGAVAVGYVLAAFAVSRWMKLLAPAVAPELAIVLAAAAAWAIQSRLAPYPGKEG